MAARSPLPHHPPPPPATATGTSHISQSALERAGYGQNSSLTNTSTQIPTTPSTSATATGGGLSRNSSAGSYYAVHQPQPQHPMQKTVVDNQTLSNTLANTHLTSTQPPDDSVQGSNRQPKFTEEWDASVRGSSIINGPAMQRSNSISSRSEVLHTRDRDRDDAASGTITLSRGNTLKKKASLRRNGSLKRSSSRRSMRAGSVRSLALQSSHDADEVHSAFFCPVPTSGNPTETLANRFQAWRKILKDLISYFREIQTHYEHRSKSLIKLSNVLNNTTTPAGFLSSGGLDDALQVLRSYHKTAILEANKAKEIEEDVILALTGLRSDLNQKMKEIKSLSGDFKNSVEKEMDSTRRAVKALQDVLGQSELDSALTTGKQDPYLLRLAVDRQVERQIDEENYLHQAYLNLESSGRELEAIVVGEIQKSYNAYAGILKRESDAAYNAIDELRLGPIAMPKDYEWQAFVERDNQFVDPDIPVRSAEHIHYPGREHFACQEIRAGLLERKSKYLKSYTAGWYVLSPTHLHEFKSADKTQAPVMSLYLPEQKLGSHSTAGGSSNKFILKGRQTGSMHRGHTWVFRAESHDTMMAWYEDIKALTEKSPEELNTFVRGHARTYSRSSQRSVSSDGMVDDDDDEPFVSNANAAAVVATPGPRNESLQSRPQPGGRFPSDLQVNANRGLQVPLSPSSTSSGFLDNSENQMRGADHATSSNQMSNADGANNSDYEAIAAAGMLPGSGVGEPYPGNRASQLVGQNYGNTLSINMDTAPSHAALIHNEAAADGVNPYSGEPVAPRRSDSHNFSNAPIVVAGPSQVSPVQSKGVSQPPAVSRTSSYPVVNGHPAPEPAPATQFVAVTEGTQTGEKEQAQYAGAGNPFAQDNETLVSAQTTQPAQKGQVSQTGPIRPIGRRTDSIPHIPGEYPRGTPVQQAGL